MLADGLAYVIGVDSHRDRHALALVDAVANAPLLACEVAAAERGYREALATARRRAPGPRAWALEGSGSYGRGLARFLLAHGEVVLEVERPRREGRRGRLKSDALDALRAARLLLGERPLARPREGGRREALRCLLTVRESAVGAPPGRAQPAAGADRHLPGAAARRAAPAHAGAAAAPLSRLPGRAPA